MQLLTRVLYRQFFQQDVDEFGFDEAADTVVESHC